MFVAGHVFGVCKCVYAVLWKVR